MMYRSELNHSCVQCIWSENVRSQWLMLKVKYNDHLKLKPHFFFSVAPCYKSDKEFPLGHYDFGQTRSVSP